MAPSNTESPGTSLSTALPPAGVPGQPAALSSRRFFIVLALICLAALIGRAAILAEYLRSNPLAAAPINDAEVYWVWAGSIAGGHLTQDAPFFSAPLYPYLLGVIRWAGGGLSAIYGIQMLMDLVTACLLAVVARRRFGAAVGLLAAALLLVLQEPASGSLRVLPTSLQLLLVTTTWGLLVGAQGKPSLTRFIAVGASTGLLSLAYAPAIILIIPIALWLFWQTDNRVAGALRAGAAAAAAALVIAPATLHNWRACGEFFPIQAVSGITLRLGNTPGSDGTYTVIPGISTERARMHDDAARVYQEATGKPPTWKAVDTYFRDQVLHDWRADPAWAFKLALRKLYWFISARNYADIYQPPAEVAAGISSCLRLTPLPVAWLVGPALIGLALMLRRPIRYAPEWMLFAVPLLTVVTFWYSPRYRAPALPIMALTAAWALDRAAHCRIHPRTAIAVSGALIASIVLGAVNQSKGFDAPDPTNVPINLAYALGRQGRLPEAVDKLREALKYKTAERRLHIVLGDVLTNLGRFDEAMTEYRWVESTAPNDAEVLGKIGRVLLQQQKLDEAGEVLTRATQLQPANAELLGLLAKARQLEGHVELAIQLFEKAEGIDPNNAEVLAAYADLLGWLGRWQEAQSKFAKVVQIAPWSFEAYHRLGVIDAQLGDFAQARTCLEKSLQMSPQDPQAWYDLGVLNLRERRLDDAAECFRRVLAINPAHEQSRKALEQIDLARAIGSEAKP